MGGVGWSGVGWGGLGWGGWRESARPQQVAAVVVVVVVVGRVGFSHTLNPARALRPAGGSVPVEHTQCTITTKIKSMREFMIAGLSSETSSF